MSKIGALVRIKPEKIEEDAISDYNALERSGYLWWLEEVARYTDTYGVLYWCRPLAGGELHQWFESEFEEIEDV